MEEEEILQVSYFFVWRPPASFDSCRILGYEEHVKGSRQPDISEALMFRRISSGLVVKCKLSI